MSKPASLKTSHWTNRRVDICSPVEMSRDYEGAWTLTQPLCATSSSWLRLHIHGSKSLGWHIFSASVSDAKGFRVLGHFKIAPSEVLSSSSPHKVPDVQGWKPARADD